MSRAWARISSDINSAGKLRTKSLEMLLRASTGATSRISVFLSLSSVNALG